MITICFVETPDGMTCKMAAIRKSCGKDVELGTSMSVSHVGSVSDVPNHEPVAQFSLMARIYYNLQTWLGHLYPNSALLRRQIQTRQ